MKKKKLVLACTALSMCAVCGTVVAVGAGSGLMTFGSTAADWTFEHYNAVAPTFDSNGSKEYWISCDDPSHNVLLTAPSEGTVNPAKDPESGFPATLASSDSRYVEAYHRVMSFEDGNIPAVLSFASGSGAVSSDCASEGTKSLKITGGFKLAFNQDYLTKVFALYGEDDDCILFDMKASAQCKDLYYSSLTKQYNVYRYDQVNNIGNDGVTTGWKTFAFKKSWLSDLKDRQVIRVDNASGEDIYIDNIRIGKPYTAAKYISFEQNQVYNNGAIRLDGWSEELKVTAESSTVLSTAISQDYASEGKNSLHITTSSATKISAFITEAMYDATDVGFLFDLYTPAGAAISNVRNRYKSEGGNVAYAPINYTQAGTWITFYAPKTAVYDDDFMLFRFDNSIVTDVYLDNVRLADPSIDFEHGEVATFNTTRYGYSPKYNGSYFNADFGAKMGADIWYQGSFNVSLTSDKSTNGAYSLKAVATAAHSGLYISDRLYQSLGTEGLQIDIWTSASINFNSLASGQSGVHDWDPGKWITITVPKAYMGLNPNTNERCVFTYGSVVTSYIDNVRLAKSVDASSAPLLSETTYNWYE